MGEEISRENDIPKDRYYYKKAIKIKRLKIGMILAIITGALFITCQLLIGVNQSWYNAERYKAYLDYQEGLITYEEYDDIREQLELDLYVNQWIISISSTIANVGLYFVFIFIIVILLSIVLDESFNRKMRRLALGLAGIFLLFILYPIFAATITTIYYIFP
ncbi:MAG: hypothetical protein ACFE8M_13935 [Candidatus Hermodarchaeota archaeon]